MAAPAPPDLEERFLPPPGWQWDYFTNRAGRTLRFGHVMPAKPVAIVTGLQGLGEFTEKYFETARELLKHDIGFWMMDWQGQGKSERYLTNSHKRHSVGFDVDIADFHLFVENHVIPVAKQADGSHLPLVMLGHSMAGNIGLRYLLHHADIFICAAFTAPMVDILALQFMPYAVRTAVTRLISVIGGQYFISLKYGNWTPDLRDDPQNDIHSRDLIRKEVHNQWCLHDPELQVGNITFGWIHEAAASCALLRRKNVARDIKTPCLFALAENEKLVDNEATRRLAKAMPDAKVLELPGAWHEILMEIDEVRARFFQSFYELMAINGIRIPQSDPAIAAPSKW